MTNSNNFADSAIVAFHIGRGGHFNNQGHRSFLGEEKISAYTNDLFISFENAYFVGKKIAGRENLAEMLDRAMSDDYNAVAFFEKIGLPLGEKIFIDCSGHHVGLTLAAAETGIGCINIDNDYDTTYTCLLSNCNEEELELIANSEIWVRREIREYAKEQLGIEDNQE